jgi:hypothetical protein
MIIPEFNISYTATAATASIATGKMLIHTVNIPKNTTGNLSFQDTANNVYFAMPTATLGGTYILDASLPAGLQLVASSAADQVTITYQK